MTFQHICLLVFVCVLCQGCASEGEKFLHRVRERYKTFDTFHSVCMQAITADIEGAGTGFSYCRVHFDRSTHRLRVARETTNDILISGSDLKMNVPLVHDRHLHIRLHQPVTTKWLASKFPLLVAEDYLATPLAHLFPIDARVLLGETPLEHWDWRAIELCESGFDDTGIRQRASSEETISLLDLHNNDIRMTANPQHREPKVQPIVVRFEGSAFEGYMTFDPDSLRISGYVLRVKMLRMEVDKKPWHLIYVVAIREIDPTKLKDGPFEFNVEDKEAVHSLKEWHELVLKIRGSGG